MSDESLTRVAKWLPLLIAAGYFAFLIATWYEYIQSRKASMEAFDKAIEEWLKNKDVPVEERRDE